MLTAEEQLSAYAEMEVSRYGLYALDTAEVLEALARPRGSDTSWAVSLAEDLIANELARGEYVSAAARVCALVPLTAKPGALPEKLDVLFPWGGLGLGELQQQVFAALPVPRRDAVVAVELDRAATMPEQMAKEVRTMVAPFVPSCSAAMRARFEG